MGRRKRKNRIKRIVGTGVLAVSILLGFKVVSTHAMNFFLEKPLASNNENMIGGHLEEEKLAEAATEEKRNLPIPLSGKYPDMVVEKLEFDEPKEDDKVIYITIDDGPCSTTPQLLDLLDELGVKATFFVTAQFGTEEEIIASLKMIHDRGHEASVHTYSHKYDEVYASVDAYLKDYKKIDDLIVKATGKRSHVYRFPGGSNAGYNKGIRTKLIKEMNSRGLVYHDWNTYDGGCDGLNAKQQIAQSVEQCSAFSKSVLLMHNIPGKDEVLETLPEIIRQLKEMGYRFDVLDGTVKPFQFAKVEE